MQHCLHFDCVGKPSLSAFRRYVSLLQSDVLFQCYLHFCANLGFVGILIVSLCTLH